MTLYLVQCPEKIVGFSKESEKGFRYVVDPKTDILTEMKVSPYASLVFSCLPKIVKLLVDNGLNIIFDECNFHCKLIIDNYKSLFSHHKFLMVGVKCDLATLEERELIRGDRVLGMVKIFHQREKNFHYPYDLFVDSTYTSPFTNAKKILQFLNEKETRSVNIKNS